MILWFRELGVWFHAAATYVILAVFGAVTGLVFWKAAEEAAGKPFDPALLLFGPVYFWLMIVVLVAIIAMRLLVEDRRSGMLEMISTAPVSEWQIVLAKYAGGMTVFMTACLVPAGYPFLAAALRQTGGAPAPGDWTPLAGGFLALFLCGALLNAIGVLCAAFLKGSAATVMTVFSLCSLLFVMDQIVSAVGGPRVAATLQAVVLAPAIRDFARGIIDTRPIILWLSTTVFCLFAAQRVLLWQRTTHRT